MPRIYATYEHTENQGQVAFLHGAAAVPSGTDTSGFAAKGYTVDSAKHTLAPWDRMSPAELDELLACFGVSVSASATKAEKVAAFEAAVPASVPFDALTVTVEASDTEGKIKISLTPATGCTYYRIFLASGEDPEISRGDAPDDDWTAMTLTEGVEDGIEPAEDAESVAVIGVKAGVAIALAVEALPATDVVS
jgi:hypothetical protein